MKYEEYEGVLPVTLKDRLAFAALHIRHIEYLAVFCRFQGHSGGGHFVLPRMKPFTSGGKNADFFASSNMLFGS